MLTAVTVSAVRARGCEKCVWNCAPKGSEPLPSLPRADEVQLSVIELWNRESQVFYG